MVSGRQNSLGSRIGYAGIAMIPLLKMNYLFVLFAKKFWHGTVRCHGLC